MLHDSFTYDSSWSGSGIGVVRCCFLRRQEFSEMSVLFLMFILLDSETFQKQYDHIL